MLLLISLDEVAKGVTMPVRGAVTAGAKLLLSWALRAAADLLTFFADSLDPAKKEKGLNVVWC